jgi:DNA processing protein
MKGHRAIRETLPENSPSLASADVWGNPDLLRSKSIGVCGSRHASEAGLKYAHILGHVAADQSLVVVSGYAAGVDEHAHRGALEAGGATIAVLPEGIDHFSIRKSLRPLVTASNFLAVSEFPADAIWKAWRAMERNKTIIAIADAMFVVEAGEKGGTLDAGMEALRAGVPLFVLEFKAERPTTKGNKMLIDRGATAVSSMRALRESMSAIRSGSVQSRRLM